MKQLPHPEPCQLALADVLDALGDPVRLNIVSRLKKGREHSASDFDVDVSSSTLSHHLKVLRLAGIISHRKDGTRCFVTLRPELDQAFPGLMDTVQRLTLTR